jgi:hypothetical protein
VADTAAQLASLSQWIDDSYASDLHPETVLWRRVAKAGEEHGEAMKALGGLVGENPRKGVTHDREDLIEELLDEAVAALGAVEHLTGNRCQALGLLHDKVDRVLTRSLGVEHCRSASSEGVPCTRTLGHAGAHRGTHPGDKTWTVAW